MQSEKIFKNSITYSKVEHFQFWIFLFCFFVAVVVEVAFKIRHLIMYISFCQALAATPRQPRHSFSRCTTSTDTILSNWRSTSTQTRLCTVALLTDLPLGATLVSTTSTYQTLQQTTKMLKPSVAQRTLFLRDIQPVSVHFLLEAIISHRLILKCFTRQLLRTEIVWHPTVILRNRAEYRLIISRRVLRSCGLNSDDIPQDWAG